MEKARCEGCNRLVDPSSILPVWVEVCRRTFSSPAEHEERMLCDICRHWSTEDEAYERANQVYRERTGSEL